MGVTDTTCSDGIMFYPLDWSTLPRVQHFEAWFDRTVENHSCATRSNFQEVRIREPPRIQA